MQMDSILAFWNYNETTLRNDANILSTINRRDVALDYLGRPVNLNWVLGGVRRDASGAVVSAECFQTVLYMKYNPVRCRAMIRFKQWRCAESHR